MTFFIKNKRAVDEKRNEEKFMYGNFKNDNESFGRTFSRGEK
jgi:hypothetical protein